MCNEDVGVWVCGGVTWRCHAGESRTPPASLTLACSKMSLDVFLIEGMKGYQMLFTGSKNIVPVRSYRDLKFGFYMRLQCGRAL